MLLPKGFSLPNFCLATICSTMVRPAMCHGPLCRHIDQAALGMRGQIVLLMGWTPTGWRYHIGKKITDQKNTVVGSNEICSQTRPNSYGNEKFNGNVIYYPRKSKTKHRMVFIMIHVRDSLPYNYQWAKSFLWTSWVLVGDSHHSCYILSFQVKSWKHTKTYGEKKPINAFSISIDLCKIWTTSRINIIVYINKQIIYICTHIILAQNNGVAHFWMDRLWQE